MTEILKYDPKRAVSPVDKILLRGAASGKSPKELSALTNGVVKPAQAAARVLEILDSRDWLTEAHQRLLLTDSLMDLHDTLYERAIEFRDLDAAKPLLSVLTLIDKRLSTDKFDLQKAMTEISRAHAGLMLAGISTALERSFLELEKRYPDVKKSELTEIFQLAMPDVVREIESRVPVE